MKTKTRSLIVLALTLIIGIVIGAIGSNMLRENRFKSRMEGFRNPEKFIERVERAINPTPEQKAILRQILLKRHQRMVEMGETFRSRMKVQADSMKAELDSLLTPEQMRKMERMFRRGERNHHRPDRPPVRREEKTGNPPQ